MTLRMLRLSRFGSDMNFDIYVLLGVMGARVTLQLLKHVSAADKVGTSLHTQDIC